METTTTLQPVASLMRQRGLNRSQVVVVGDGGHGRAVHGAVFLHRHHAGGIRYLLDTNDAFHIVIFPPVPLVHAQVGGDDMRCTSLVPS